MTRVHALRRRSRSQWREGITEGSDASAAFVHRQNREIGLRLWAPVGVSL